MEMKDGAIGQRAEGTNPLKGEQPTLENFGGVGAGEVRRGSDNHQQREKMHSTSFIRPKVLKRKWEKTVQSNLVFVRKKKKIWSLLIPSIQQFSTSFCNLSLSLSLCLGMQVNKNT